MKTLFKLLFALAAAAIVPAAHAQAKWDFPTPYPDSIYHTQNIRTFIEEVKKATNGQWDANVHSNASLIKLPDILRAVQTGQVNIGEILLGQFGNEDPLLELDNIPFLASGFDNSFRLYQAHKATVEKRMLARGIRVLYSVAWPGQAIFTKQPIKTMEDLKGVKFRSYSPVTARLAELSGAIPTTVQAAEVPQAFATNIVSAMITSAATGVVSKSWEFSKYYYDMNAFHPRNAVIVNERAFQRLPEPVRNAILAAATAADKRGWELARQNQTSQVKALADNGTVIVTPDATMTASYAKIGETMLAEWLKRAGPEGEAVIKAYRR